MLRITGWALALICVAATLLVSGSAGAASSGDKQPGFAVYTVSSSPAVLAAHGIRPQPDKVTSPGTNLPLNPVLLGLARDGHVQNIRVLGDGSVNLLADAFAVSSLKADGSSVVPARPPIVSARPQSGTIAGTVTSGGSGVTGATVSAILGSEVVTTTTGIGGAYTLTVSGTGDYQVGVSATGYQWQPAVMVAVPAGASDVNFALVQRNLTITGRVRSQPGNVSVPNVQVYAWDLIQDNFTAGDSTVTDVNGVYTLTVSSAMYEIRAFYPPFGAQSQTVNPPASNKNFTFSPPPTFTLSGVIRKSDGSPLPGGELTVNTIAGAFNSCDPWYAATAIVGADGSYSVNLPSSTYQVAANWPNEFRDHWVINSMTTISLTQNTTGFDMVMPAVGTIQGTVRDPNGVALPYASIYSWRTSGGNYNGFDAVTQADASGNYVVTATLGTHSLLAFSDSYTSSPVTSLNLTGNLTGIDLQVTNGIAVAGQLTGSDAAQLRWADVTYQSGPPSAPFTRHGVVYYNGQWRSTLPQGSVTINASQPYYVDGSQTINVVPNQPPVNFTLTRKDQMISGRVLTIAGGGLCDTYMTAHNLSTGVESLGNTTGSGDYRLMVASGTYNVWPYKHNSNSPAFEQHATVPPNATVNFTLTEIMFTDVYTNSPFFQEIGYMVYRGIASGYADGTFRPNNNTTRGQVSKMIVLGEGWTIDTTGGPHFSDVQPDNPFYQYIETAYNHGVITGYSDGTFRWGANVTRGQLSKIVVLSEGWAIDTTGGPHFSDVGTDNPFYQFIETAYNHHIISGYSDGTFRWGNNATRGQISKIMYNALTQP